MTSQAQSGDVVVLTAGDGTRVQAVVRLDSTPPLMLMIGRPVDPAILEHMARTEQAVAEYQRLDKNRSWLQVAFAWIFATRGVAGAAGGGADRAGAGQPDRASDRRG